MSGRTADDATRASDRLPRRRAARVGLRALAALVVVVMAAALTAPLWFDARRVATLALARADAATGLTWSFDGDPELRWRPQPWLALPRLAARDAEGRTVLSAERLELSLPWSTLRGETVRVEAIALTAPRLDLDAALAWWQRLPDGDGALPVLDGFAIDRGEIVAPGLRFSAVEIDLPHFSLGVPLRLVASARVEPAPAGEPPVPAPFDVRLALDAVPLGAPFRLDAMAITLSGTGPVPTAVATGRLQPAPWQLDVAGEIARWPEAWPALPPPLSEGDAPLAFAIAQAGDVAMEAPAAISVRRDGSRIDATLVPAALRAWIDGRDASPLPPLQGQAILPRLVVEGASLEGVSVEIGRGRAVDEPRP